VTAATARRCCRRSRTIDANGMSCSCVAAANLDNGGSAARTSAPAVAPTPSGTPDVDCLTAAALAPVPDSTLRVWSGLERGLQKYLAALRARAGLLDDIDGLQEQNDQLRAVLGDYLRADVNKELAFPPAATARLAGE